MKKKLLALLLAALAVGGTTRASAASYGEVNYYSILARLRSWGVVVYRQSQSEEETPVEQQEPESGTEAEAQSGTDAQAQAETGTQTQANSTYAAEVLALVNRYRAENGLNPLTLDSELSRVAQAKAQDMRDNSYFSHTSPTYGSPFDMMRSFGITYSYAGENIAMGYSSPEAVVTAWMNSAGHRANILNENFTKMGLGYVRTGNYWSQLFTG